MVGVCSDWRRKDPCLPCVNEFSAGLCVRLQADMGMHILKRPRRLYRTFPVIPTTSAPDDVH
jgi:hypothetical protein